jgi:biopolymer transport protein ExbB
MLATLLVYAAWFQETGGTQWDLRAMWTSMGLLAKIVVVILFILSVYSFGVMIDRFLMYNNARKQSRLFVQQVADAEVIEAAKRGLERSVAIVHAEMKRGLSALATIGSTAPFVGLFGTVVGILNAFKGIAANKATGLSAVAGGIAEALVTTAFGLLVAVPAVWAYNYFTNKVEAFDVEMDNSSMELINYFILRRGAKK